MSMRLLVSVRTVDEARLAAAHGADFIDLKEPRDGALGGLPPATVRAIVQALRAQGCALPLSATIGDLPMTEVATIVQRCMALCSCGVDYVKVGVEPGRGAAAVLDALAGTAWPAAAIVPVFIADRGIDFALVARARGFPALMVDTADKVGGSLFERVALADLQRFVHEARTCGALAGLAGALRLQHLPALAALGPDFAGFRSAVCAGSRGSALDARRVRELASRLRAHDVASHARAEA